MKALKFFLINISSLGIVCLGACGGGNQTASNPPRSATTETTSRSPESHSESGSPKNHSNVSKGGQVIESGPYHLEFISVKENSGTHLDFYLQKGNTHAAIPNAKVTAQIQLLDGTQKSLDLKYDFDGKHYTVMIPSTVTGEYKVLTSPQP